MACGRRPGPAIAAILALAFAIGLFAAVVSVLQAFLFRPLIVHDVDRVVRVRERITASAGNNIVNPSPAIFDAWRSKQTVFEDMAAATGQSVAVEGNLESESLSAGMVTANFFHVLGVAPQLGRDFEAGEDRSGHDNVAILSDDTWRNRFNADPSIIGRQLRIDGETRTVVGVMPRNFSHPYGAELWLPFRWDRLLTQTMGNFLYVPARLRPGLSIAAAQVELDATARAIHAAQPELGQGDAASLRPMREETLEDLQTTLWVLFASALFVVLVATFNTAAVFYAQGIADARATVVRVALGATNAALFRRALARSGLVVGFATMLGMLAALQFSTPLLALGGGSSIREFDAVVRYGFADRPLDRFRGRHQCVGAGSARRASRAIADVIGPVQHARLRHGSQHPPASFRGDDHAVRHVLCPRRHGAFLSRSDTSVWSRWIVATTATGSCWPTWLFPTRDTRPWPRATP